MFNYKNEKIWRREMHDKFKTLIIEQYPVDCIFDIGLHHGEITFAIKFSTKDESTVHLKNGVLKKIEEDLIVMYNENRSKNNYLEASGYRLIEILFKSKKDIGYILSNGMKN